MPTYCLAACLAALTLSVSAPMHALGAAPLPAVALEPGDLVFQASRSRQADAIRLATGSRWSHVAIVERGGHGATVLEAIEPVSRTPWERWRRRGLGEVLVMRVRGLDPATKVRAAAEARRFLGRPYDARFKVPGDLELVTPASIADDPRLEVVYRGP